MVVLAGHACLQPLRPRIFLASLLRRLHPHFLCVSFGPFCTPDRYVLGHSHSYRLSIGIECSGPLMSMLMSLLA